MEGPIAENCNINWWIKKQNFLDGDDRNMVMSGSWLNNKIIYAVRRIGIKAHNNDVETSLLSQTLTGFKAIATDGINILHDKNHWVASRHSLPGRLNYVCWFYGRPDFRLR